MELLATADEQSCRLAPLRNVDQCRRLRPVASRPCTEEVGHDSGRLLAALSPRPVQLDPGDLDADRAKPEEDREQREPGGRPGTVSLPPTWHQWHRYTLVRSGDAAVEGSPDARSITHRIGMPTVLRGWIGLVQRQRHELASAQDGSVRRSRSSSASAATSPSAASRRIRAPAETAGLSMRSLEAHARVCSLSNPAAGAAPRRAGLAAGGRAREWSPRRAGCPSKPNVPVAVAAYRKTPVCPRE